MITAASVPSWVMAVKADPTSSPPKNCPTIDWWALEEIGRNSVSPCTTPSTRASSHPIYPCFPSAAAPSTRHTVRGRHGRMVWCTPEETRDTRAVTIHAGHPFATPEPERDPLRRWRGRMTAPVSVWAAGDGTGRVGWTLTAFVIADGEPPEM